MGVAGPGRPRPPASPLTRQQRQPAEGDYESFRVVQDRDYEGDFEREAKRLATQRGIETGPTDAE